jgi:TolB-like protein
MLNAIKTNRYVLVVAAAIALLGCGNASMDPATVKTLAVMPIDDGTVQKDFGELADSVTDHLAVSLGTMQGVNVIASTSSLQYRLRPRELADIRKTFAADALLEGSVDIQGENLTLSAWLVNPQSGKRVWETKANGKREAAFTLAEQVSANLAAWLKHPLRMRQGEVAATWQHFLFLAEGRKLTFRFDPIEVNLAVYDLEKLRGDYPDYHPARSATAELFGRLVATEFLTGDKAREWVKGILYEIRMDEPESAEAYYAEGALHYWVDWNFAAAETSLKKAIERRPNLMGAWQSLAQVYIATNRLQLAEDTMAQAAKIDPLGFETLRDYAAALAANEKWTPALATLDQAGALTKQERLISIMRGEFLLGKGDLEPARVAVGGYVTGRQEMANAQALYGAIQARQGHLDETRKIITTLELLPKRELAPADPIHFALLHLGLGQDAVGYQELSKAVASRRTFALHLPGNPAFVKYRNNPRFQAIIAQVAASKPLPAAATTP